MVQHIRQAKDTVHNVPKRLKDGKQDLDDLLDTLCLVKREKNLHTPAVRDQVQAVYQIAIEIHESLRKMEQDSRRSIGRQYFHALRYSKDEDHRLNALLHRLHAAKNELATRILLVQVHITGKLSDGMTAALPVIARTNENVQQVLEGQISSVIEDDGQCSKTRGIFYGPDAQISGLTNTRRGEFRNVSFHGRFTQQRKQQAWPCGPHAFLRGKPGIGSGSDDQRKRGHGLPGQGNSDAA